MLEARPLLLQRRLAPLFATHAVELSEDSTIWKEGEFAADTAPLCKSDGPSFGPGTSRSTGSDSVQEFASTRATASNIRSSIVAHLNSLESADGRTGLNRALLHNFLFVAWQRNSGADMASTPIDDFAVDASWRLSTGKAASSVCIAHT